MVSGCLNRKTMFRVFVVSGTATKETKAMRGVGSYAEEP